MFRSEVEAVFHLTEIGLIDPASVRPFMDHHAVSHQACSDGGLDAFAQAAECIGVTKVVKRNVDVVAARLASISPGVGHVLWGLIPATDVLDAEDIDPATVDGPSNVEACFGLIRNDAFPFIIERN